MESSGIHVEPMWNPCGINHSILIPHGIHDVHGIRNWLGSQPTFIPWIPYGIHDGFHGFHMDSIRNNLGKVKTSGGRVSALSGWLCWPARGKCIIVESCLMVADDMAPVDQHLWVRTWCDRQGERSVYAWIPSDRNRIGSMFTSQPCKGKWCWRPTKGGTVSE